MEYGLSFVCFQLWSLDNGAFVGVLLKIYFSYWKSKMKNSTFFRYYESMEYILVQLRLYEVFYFLSKESLIQ